MAGGRWEHNEPDAALIAAYDGVVCDLDGVVYRGFGAVPDAPKALQDLTARGVKVVYATNNASRVAAEVADQIAGLGAPATPADVVSSAQAGAARLARELDPGARVLALGGDGVVEALTEAGLAPCVRPTSTRAPAETCRPCSRASARTCGCATSRPPRACSRPGLPWVATNDDATLPLPWGQSPGNGAYVDLLAGAVGRRPDDVVGKPHPPLYRLALDRLGTEPSRTLAIGDRLATDIVGARGGRHRLGLGAHRRRPPLRPRGVRRVPDLCHRLALRAAPAVCRSGPETPTAGAAVRAYAHFAHGDAARRAGGAHADRGGPGRGWRPPDRARRRSGRRAPLCARRPTRSTACSTACSTAADSQESPTG